MMTLHEGHFLCLLLRSTSRPCTHPINRSNQIVLVQYESLSINIIPAVHRMRKALQH